MATLRQALLATLNADATLATILTGGVHDASILPREGMGLGAVPVQADGVTIQPFAVVRWGVANPAEVVALSERRSVTIWVYQHVGFAVIEAACKRLKQLLHQAQLATDDAGYALFQWTQDGGELPADELGGAAGSFIRFTVNYVRS